MKKSIGLFLILTFFAAPTHAQYSVKSSYLMSPEKAIGYVDSCATFWLNAYDSTLGGFFTNIDKYGNVITSWGTNKNMLSQTRDAYGFVRAYMLTGDTTYLQMARAALNFMYQHAWDTTHGGWFSELDINGNSPNPNADKSAFDQHYALLGISAYYEATYDTTDWSWLLAGYDHNENIYWDPRTSYLGYYDLANFDGSNPHNKSFNATVDAITTHLLYLYLLTEDQTYKNRLTQLAEQIINHMVASMDQQAIGFVERYDSDWGWDNSELMTIMGHLLKAAWCLGRLYQIDPDTSYISAAEKLVLEVWQNGYDHEFGGPYKDYNRVTGQMLMWGNPDTAKAWWQMEQAVVAGLELFEITGDSLYLQMADEALDFFMKYFVDHEYGEVYENRTRYGTPTWGEHKGNGFKAGYHSIELGYYAYLYGSLFVKQEPVTLHYNFVEASEDRIIQLTPLAIADSNLRIQEILWEEQAYADYDPEDRILNLPAGVSGHFEVTYEPVYPTALTEQYEEALPKSVELCQNHPNPFNLSTAITYRVPKSTHVVLKIYNLLGQEIKTLVNEIQTAGQKSFVWDGRNQLGQLVSPGIYIYRLQVGDEIQNRRMVFVK